MSEINTVFNKSSKQLLSLAKTLKNNTALQGRVLESVLVKRNVATIKKRKDNHKFSKHPDRLSLESDTSFEPIKKNGYSDSSLCFNYRKSCDASVMHSESSVLSHSFIQQSKSSGGIIFSPNRSFRSDTDVTVQSRKREGSKKRAIKSIPFNKTAQDFSEKINKWKMHDSIIKMKSASSKAFAKTNVPSKSSEVSSAVHKKNIDKKLRELLQRISSCMEDIRITMMTGIEVPDGSMDWERARIKTVEFSARFGRNHLYQLGRQMNQLQVVTKASGNISSRTARNIHNYLLTTHQTILQALQTYRNHMSSILSNALAERLQYIIEQISILCGIHMKYVNLGQTGSSRRESLIDALRNRCIVMLDKVHDAIEKRQQAATCSCFRTRLMLMGYNVDVKKPSKAKPRKKTVLEARLSMYSIASGIRTKDAFWKKTVETLAKEKLRYNHVQSRYKTAGFKHRLQEEKPTVIELPGKSKLFDRRSSCLLRNTPITTPANEDEILTMVEVQSALDSSNTSNVKKDVPRVTDCGEQSNVVRDKQLQALTPLIQGLCQQVCAKDGEAVSQKQLEILLKGLLGMALDGKINNNNNDNESGSKKNGFVPIQNDTTNEIVQNISQQMSNNLETSLCKNYEQEKQKHEEEILEKQAQMLLEAKNEDIVVENKKSLKKEKQLDSSVVITETKTSVSTEGKKIKKNSANLSVLETTKDTKGELEEFNTTRKIDNNQSSTKNKNKRRQTVTVTGVKNAQLIHIRDEDSIIQSSDESKSVSVNNKNNNERTSNKETNEVQKNVKKNSNKPIHKNKGEDNLHAGKSTKGSIKISRLPKKLLKQLVLIPKAQACNVIQYKLHYNKFTKGNHMYRKSSKVQPWAIVDTISEHLMNDLLLSIAREIQVDQILESLYQSEFQ